MVEYLCINLYNWGQFGSRKLEKDSHLHTASRERNQPYSPILAIILLYPEWDKKRTGGQLQSLKTRNNRHLCLLSSPVAWVSEICPVLIHSPKVHSIRIFFATIYFQWEINCSHRWNSHLSPDQNWCNSQFPEE